jgi:hypothetical protein
MGAVTWKVLARFVAKFLLLSIKKTQSQSLILSNSTQNARQYDVRRGSSLF